MSEVELTINGQAVTAKSGQTILEAAREAGIEIPTLCEHPALSDWGACRMCLVEVEGMRGLQTSCTCPVSDGMEVRTKNEHIDNVRRFVLELLFSERNHYCMYCQMSGDCELQDLAYEHGLDHFTYPRPYERLEVDASRKYFIMDHNRCILCSRCIRACSEIAANHTLNLRNRGAESMVVADLDVPFGDSSCIECGTCLQVCPTGALIDARSAYGGREKDVTHTTTTCIQCGVGCTLDVVTRYDRLLRVDGVWDSEPNRGLLCVRGRFEPLYEKRQRLTAPLVRKDGALKETGWDEALSLVAEKLQAGKVLGLAGCANSNEALEAFAALMEKVDAGAGRVEPTAPELGYGERAQIRDILDADYIVVAGADPLEEQKVVGYFIKRAADQGATVALITEDENGLEPYAELNVDYTEAGKVVEAALQAEKPVVVYSVDLQDEAIEALEPLADKARFLALAPASNGPGARAAGLEPMELDDADVVYLMLGERTDDEVLLEELNGAFTIVQGSYASPLTERADVVLPAPLWYERSGHITNLEGQVKALTPVLEMPEDVRDETSVLETLAEKVK
ncbi:MAG: molybdopterin-dependent oxidoreductase [Anaerolineales bacterium]